MLHNLKEKNNIYMSLISKHDDKIQDEGVFDNNGGYHT